MSTDDATDRIDDGAPSIRSYYVDEAGDPCLFNKQKEVVVGKEPVSKRFFLGLLDARDSAALDAELISLRESLLNDPYFQKIPSMQPSARKTAISFHAKDDCPEVRKEVFDVLMKHDVSFFAVLRNKYVIVKIVQERNKRLPPYRYNPNHLYDKCVSRLFRDRLHKDDGYSIHFSLRSDKPRTEALQSALERARDNFRAKWKIESSAPIEIVPGRPESAGGLQAVDYFLWALQRLYERGEDRYWDFVSSKASLVYDVDDVRNAEYGEYYTKKKPLTLDKIEKLSGI